MSFLSIAVLSVAQANAWKTPITFLPLPTSPDSFVRELGSADRKFKLEGDTLTILVRGTGEKMYFRGTVDIPLQRLAGTQVWLAQMKYPHWEEAFFSYWISDSPGWKEGVQPSFWFGKKAPKQLKAAKTLQGKLWEEKVQSQAHGAARKVTVYVPPGATPKLPALYLADGQGCEGFARVLEPLILAKKVRPVAIVGVHCGEYKGDKAAYDFELDFRAREYLKAFQKEDYGKHVKFFFDEVTQWATAKFQLSSSREDRAIAGFSNGGAFALTASTERPEVFGHVISMSVAATNFDDFKKSFRTGPAPSYHFAAGRLEPFIANTQKAHEVLLEANIKSQFQAYESGHETEMWKIHTMAELQKFFPAKD